jgi:thiosulfate/3-mercaptopyruvate sulfurtransferase
MHPLITPNQLEELVNTGADILICDCRFDLTNPQAGREAYNAGHILGAIYVDLDRDLSAAKTGNNGRHPLPTPKAWADTKQRLGIDPKTTVIAYDNHGSVYASRLWWMLKASGHANVQVLDGGLSAWNGSIGTIPPVIAPLKVTPAPQEWAGTVTVDAIEECITDPNLQGHCMIDARAEDRFRGENETLDAIGGHIPGALNRFFKHNLSAGQFKSPEVLRTEFKVLLGNTPTSKVINQCGSGVSACHNLLAMEVAGLSGSRLYVGSWSEWCTNPKRPIATT